MSKKVLHRFKCKALVNGIIYAVSEAGMPICECPQFYVQFTKLAVPVCPGCITEMVYDGSLTSANDKYRFGRK